MSSDDDKRGRHTISLTEEQQRKIDEILQGKDSLSIDHRGEFIWYWGEFQPERLGGGSAIRVQVGTSDDRIFTLISPKMLPVGILGTVRYRDETSGEKRTILGTIRHCRTGQRQEDASRARHLCQFIPTIGD
ncbi:hypothetical protein BI364_07185 [Acidihalobacter yilgarnensis]|uniref:Uncharacterized protein n=1 Tax=Acidihalobacter yilgarnensis TaxID=2819280 RepID=A0A1D8IMS9_9GAMM|nr:hypothetical protein [Acidihalobacter yilgarnensis]AOU97776.1 hypothetical protein BI364_07185 [Acidihalobacter yilgarnensis]